MKAKILVYVLPALILTAIQLAEAQQQPTKIPLIGYLMGRSPDPVRSEALRQGLRELGYVEGKTIVIEWRSAEGKLDRLPALVAELVDLKVDVIVTGGPLPTRVTKDATFTIPIVMTQVNDPVGNGFVASRARPGGNITGLSTLAPEISGKQLELLKEIIPKLSRVAVFGTSTQPGNSQVLNGGLMFYGVNLTDLDRRAATYIDKILKGVKPADLPVEQPKKFEFIINLKAAKQIGLTIPPNVLVRADRVIR
jgi:putative ABC transport system substrate-binding protein